MTGFSLYLKSSRKNFIYYHSVSWSYFIFDSATVLYRLIHTARKIAHVIKLIIFITHTEPGYKFGSIRNAKESVRCILSTSSKKV